MPNNYFQFKQFTIYQDRCALKVSTDSCIFGAWIAKRVSTMQCHMNACLDIGAGSGLLMLMMAQQFPGKIDGVEIDEACCEQAAENLATSSWHNRLHIFHDDVKLFSFPHRYDIVISNPPFFEGDLQSPDQRLNRAKHSETLTLQDLLELAERNLTDRGILALLIPYQRMEWFQQLAASYGLYAHERLLIRQSQKHPYFRAALLLNRENSGDLRSHELIIHGEGATYTTAFVNLLKDYYLYL